MFDFKKKQKEENKQYLKVVATDTDGKQNVSIDCDCDLLLIYNTILSLSKELLDSEVDDIPGFITTLTFDLLD